MARLNSSTARSSITSAKTLDELKEWSSTDAIHPEDLPASIAVWGRSLEGRQPYDIELRQRRADGVFRWFQVQGL
jgi:PAS fold